MTFKSPCRAPRKAEDPVAFAAMKGRRAEAAARNARLQLSSDDPDALLRVDTVCALTGLSVASIYRRMAAKDSDFPKAVKLGGGRCTRFRAGDVREWLRAQAGGQ